MGTFMLVVFILLCKKWWTDFKKKHNIKSVDENMSEAFLYHEKEDGMLNHPTYIGREIKK